MGEWLVMGCGVGWENAYLALVVADGQVLVDELLLEGGQVRVDVVGHEGDVRVLAGLGATRRRQQQHVCQSGQGNLLGGHVKLQHGVHLLVVLGILRRDILRAQ